MTNLLRRINHKRFNGLSTQHEKQYLGILHGSREKWYRIRFSWESSWHFAMLPALVSPWNDASVERAQNWIPYWWRVTTQIWEINKNSSHQQKTGAGYRCFVRFFSVEDYWARYGCQPGHIADTTNRNKLWLRAALKLLKPNNQASGASHWVWRRVIRRAEKQRNTVKAGRNICWQKGISGGYLF